MSQTGETKYSIDLLLEQQEAKLGLPPLKSLASLEDYIQASPQEVDGWDAEKCLEAARVIAQYGIAVQRTINKELAITNWAENLIKKIISNDLSKYPKNSYEERRYLAIVNNEDAAKLDKIRAISQAKIDGLSYLPSRLQFLADRFIDSFNFKRGKFR